MQIMKNDCSIRYSIASSSSSSSSCSPCPETSAFLALSRIYVSMPISALCGSFYARISELCLSRSPVLSYLCELHRGTIYWLSEWFEARSSNCMTSYQSGNGISMTIVLQMFLLSLFMLIVQAHVFRQKKERKDHLKTEENSNQRLTESEDVR